MRQRLKVLFLCTGNSCRSQMAEGLCRHFVGADIEAFSAGIEKHGLNPLAVRAMQELDVDISGHQSRSLGDFPELDFDWVITVCGHAHETCPVFPGSCPVVHVGFDDPPKLARESANDDEAMQHYRRVRDEIAVFIKTLPESLVARHP